MLTTPPGTPRLGGNARTLQVAGERAPQSGPTRKSETQQNSLTPGSNFAGINPWWTYEEDAIPGVGKYMVNVGGNSNLLIQADDMAIPNRGVDLAFRRTYNSHAPMHDYDNDDQSGASNYGNGWTNNFDVHIAYNSGNASGQGISVFDGDGARYDYLPDGKGNYVAPPGQHATLTFDGNSGYFWTKKNGTVYYFYAPNACSANAQWCGLAGRITTIWGRNRNNFLQFRYSFDNEGPTSAATLNQIEVIADSTGPGTGRVATLKFADYSGRRLLQSLQWPNGTVVSYAYDSSGNLTEVDEPPNDTSSAACSIVTRCLPTVYQYYSGTSLIANVFGARWKMSAGTDGGYVHFVYTSANGVNEIDYGGLMNPTLPDGTGIALQTGISSTAFVYRRIYSQVQGETTDWSDSDGHHTVYTYDANGRVTRRDDSTGKASPATLTSTRGWDADNNLLFTVDPRGAASGNLTAYRTDYAYDAHGNTIAVAQPPASVSVNGTQQTLRPTSLYTYDERNNLVGYCDPQSNARASRNWNGSGTPPSCPTGSGSGAAVFGWTYPTYEPDGELTSATTPLGYTSTISYAAAAQSGTDFGLPTSVRGTEFTQADGTSIAPGQNIVYDAFGDVVCFSNSGGTQSAAGWWTFAYDAVGHMTAQGDPDDASLQNSACGKTAGIAGSRIVTSTTYYDNGQVKSIQMPSQYREGVATSLGYDADGNQTTATLHYGCTSGSCTPATTTRWYDGADRLIEVKSAADSTTNNGKAGITRYLYDLKQGQEVSVGELPAFRAYGNLYKTQVCWGTCTTISDLSADAYDALDRVVAHYAESPQNGFQKWTKTYDAGADAGLLSSETDPLSQTKTFGYDADGLLNALVFTGDGGITPNRAYVHDANGRLTDLTSTSLGTYRYTYDGDGNLSSYVEPSTIPGAATLKYEHYPNGWRKALDVTAGTFFAGGPLLQYSYRADGLRSTLNVANYSRPFAWTYTNGGRELTQSDPYTGNSIAGHVLTARSSTYDADGRQSSLTLPFGGSYRDLSYDAEEEPLSYTLSDPAAPTRYFSTSFAYNALGEFQSEKVNNSGPGSAATLVQYSVDVNNYLCPQLDPAHGGAVNFPYACTVSASGAIENRATSRSLVQGRACDKRTRWNYDLDGRIANRQSIDGCERNPVWSAPSPTTYDAENHTATRGGPGMLDTLKWDPSGHIAEWTQSPSGAPSFSRYYHWDGDTLLFTSDSSGKLLNYAIEHLAESEINHPALDVIDRDIAGQSVMDHDASSTTPWQVLGGPVYRGKGMQLLIPSTLPGFAGDQSAIRDSSTQSDGYDIAGVAVQGVRAYDADALQWTTPDAYPGRLGDPASQMPYMWNRNNPIAYEDPSGYCNKTHKDATDQCGSDSLPTIASVVSHCHGCHPGRPSADVTASELSNISGSWGTVPFFFLGPEEKVGEAAIDGALSLRACRIWCKWKDSTIGKSVKNTDTNLTSDEVVDALLQRGFKVSISDEVLIFTNGQVKYVVRPWADSTGKATLDYYGTSKDIQMKIRLLPEH